MIQICLYQISKLISLMGHRANSVVAVLAMSYGPITKKNFLLWYIDHPVHHEEWVRWIADQKTTLPNPNNNSVDTFVMFDEWLESSFWHHLHPSGNWSTIVHNNKQDKRPFLVQCLWQYQMRNVFTAGAPRQQCGSCASPWVTGPFEELFPFIVKLITPRPR